MPYSSNWTKKRQQKQSIFLSRPPSPPLCCNSIATTSTTFFALPCEHLCLLPINNRFEPSYIYVVALRGKGPVLSHVLCSTCPQGLWICLGRHSTPKTQFLARYVDKAGRSFEKLQTTSLHCYTKCIFTLLLSCACLVFACLAATHGRRQNFSRGERFFSSGRGTTKNDLGRGTIFEIQGMGREGVKRFFFFHN